ncbi:MAG: hypothetical protein LBM59_01725 [Ruminococcus sp.]|jgi:hypothetical protein|nr:hypothetical protein [Ruminococcus sp.]
MLRKVIKYDLKTRWLPFALIFGFGVIIPILFYAMTGNLDEDLRFTLRLLVGSLGSMVIVVGTFALSLLWLDSDLNGKTSYLISMLPVKFNNLLFSKTLFFFITTLLSFFFALLCMSLSIMNFTPFSEAYNFLELIIQSISSEAGYFIAVALMIRSLLGIVSFYGFVCAGGAFGHLFGTKRKVAEALFEIAVFLIYVLYSIIFNGLVEFSSSTATEIVLYGVDTVVAIAVTVGFFHFTNWVFTKKINVL